MLTSCLFIRNLHQKLLNGSIKRTVLVVVQQDHALFSSWGVFKGFNMSLEDVELVTKLDRCQVITSQFLTAEQPIAVDCEGKNLGVGGQLTLLQVATVEGKAYLFDVLKQPGMVRDGGLGDVMASPKLVKVMHACSADTGVLYAEYSVTSQNIFDTQVADGLIDRETQQLFARPQRSLNCVVQKYGGILNDNKEDVKKLFRNPMYWLRRPLTTQMIQYAAGDVFALVPTVYNRLKQRLDELGLTETAAILSSEVCIQLARPDEVRARRKITKSLFEKSIVDGLLERLTGAERRKDLTERQKTVVMRPKLSGMVALPPIFVQVQQNLIEEKLDEIEADCDAYAQGGQKPDTHDWSFYIYGKGQKHPNPSVSERAGRLDEKITSVGLRIAGAKSKS